MSNERYAHTLRVADTAVNLAEKWDSDRQRAYVAAIFHDVAKFLNPEKLSEMNIISTPFLDNLYQKYRAIWHSFAGPAIMKHFFKINDPKTLSAARWHTTGKAKMSKLEQIVYMADAIEPGRDFSGIAYLRDLSFKNLDHATYAQSHAILESLLVQALPIHPYSIQCRNYYLNLISKQEILLIHAQLKYQEVTNQ